MLDSTEWRSDLTEIAVEAVPCLDVVLVGQLADAAWKFLVEKLLRDLVKLHFRQAGVVDVLVCNDRRLSGQGDGCGDRLLFALATAGQQ